MYDYFPDMSSFMQEHLKLSDCSLVTSISWHDCFWHCDHTANYKVL